MTTTDVIDLATRIQRRRDFGAHLAGFVAGVAALTLLQLITSDSTVQFVGVLVAWATALSFQHFRHVLRGPVTEIDVSTEQGRLGNKHPWTC